MLKSPDYITARDLLLENVCPVGTEAVPLSGCAGRVLAQELRAAENVPAFDRSAYDGYALCWGDVQAASRETPVTLEILEEIPAGSVPAEAARSGCAFKVLTGAPVPPGTDAVVPFERTEFTGRTVTVFSPVSRWANVVRAGEDVRAGQLLAAAGTRIDPGLAGTLAAQGITGPLVFRRPVVGLISTGDEVVEVEAELAPGKIRNSNRYTLEAALLAAGLQPRYLGLAGDREEEIRDRLEQGLADCDAVMLTGGVSVGDYDRTPAAMEAAGAEMLIRGVRLKPGMACAFGCRDGKFLFALSGNPASSLTCFYAVALPALKKLAGRRDPVPQEFPVILADGFTGRSPVTRLLRGRLDLTGGRAAIRLPTSQGNVVISSAAGCNVMAIVPGGSGPLAAGTVLNAFSLDG